MLAIEELILEHCHRPSFPKQKTRNKRPVLPIMKHRYAVKSLESQRPNSKTALSNLFILNGFKYVLKFPFTLRALHICCTETPGRCNIQALTDSDARQAWSCWGTNCIVAGAGAYCIGTKPAPSAGMKPGGREPCTGWPTGPSNAPPCTDILLL